MLEIRLLGKFDLQKDGEELRLPSRKAQALLAFLLLNQGTRYRREKLAGLLWPESLESTARSRLRYALWQLREIIGEDFLISDKISITFNPEADFWVDTTDFGWGSPASLNTDELIKQVALYQGELLPGFYEDWVLRERSRLETLLDDRLQLLLDRLITDGRWREVLEWGERWISLGNSPEPAFRAMMTAYANLGNISGAAMTYHRCVETLHEQLGVEPSKETDRIYQLIFQGERPNLSSDRSPGAVGPVGPVIHRLPGFLMAGDQSPKRGSGAFVARERELAQLEEYLKQANRGSGRVAFVRGDAGRGKTSLLLEFSRRALARYDDLVVVYGSCEAYTGLGDPHLPFREILAMLAGDVENKWAKGLISREAALRLWNMLPESALALVEYGPDLIDRFISGESILERASQFPEQGAGWLERLAACVSISRARPAPINIQHSDIQKDLFEQYSQVLRNLAGKRTILVLLDDLQWADLGSISLLFHLGRRIEGQRILIVGDYRPSEVKQSWQGHPHPLVSVLSEFKHNFGEIELDLDRNDKTSGRHFVDAFLDSEPNTLSENFRQALYQHTSGHPLFTIELLHQMQEQGYLQKDENGRWFLGSELGWDELPARVEAVIAGRINRLPDRLKAVLNVASTEGELFTAEVIASVLGDDLSKVIHQLSQELEKRYDLIEPVGTQKLGQTRLSLYRFRHHLFHTYVYGCLDDVERAHFHLRVGQTLEGLYGEHTPQIAIQLARHFEEGGAAEKAVDYLLLAGETAKRQSANEQAIAHLVQGLEILNSLPESRERAQKELAFQVSLAAPLVATKGYTAPEAERAYERARELCNQSQDISLLTATLWGLWSFYLVKANHVIARQFAGQIFELAQANHDSDLLLAGYWTLGITLVHLGELVKACDLLDQALQNYHPERHQQLTYLYGQNPAVTCAVYSAFALWFRGYPNQALARSQQALSIAEHISHPFSLAFVHGMAAVFHGLRREVGAALDHAQRATALSKEGGFPFLLALGYIMRGWALAQTGKTSRAKSQMLQGIKIMETIGANLGRPIFLAFLSEVFVKSGQFEAGLDTVNEAFTVVNLNNERINLSDLYRLKGDLLESQAGASAQVAACYLNAIEIAQQQGARLLELRGRIRLIRFRESTQRQAEERQKLSDLYAWFTEGQEMDDLVEAQQLLNGSSMP
jgi:predicted ATPase/DNA-binding SARP family transcriptional activator